MMSLMCAVVMVHVHVYTVYDNDDMFYVYIVCCLGGSKDFTVLYKAYCMANSAVCMLYVHTALLNNVVCVYSTVKQCCMFTQHC